MNAHVLGLMQSLHLAEVVSNSDPETRGRLRVRLLANSMELWAGAVVPSAGEGYGLKCLPREGETVVIAFVTPEQPLVLGSIWSGQSSTPEEDAEPEEHYLVRTPAGTVMDFDDSDGPKMQVRTPQGYSITITDGEGGEVAIERGGQTVTLTSSEIAINSSGKVSVQASSVEVSAGMVKVDAGMSRFSGVVQADTVIANSVVGASYTAGAGNIW